MVKKKGQTVKRSAGRKEKKEKVWKFLFKSYPAAFWAVCYFVVWLTEGYFTSGKDQLAAGSCKCVSLMSFK